MKPLILPNGLHVTFSDETRRYYGNFYHVRLVVSCAVTLAPQLFPTADAHERALRLLGEQAVYRRSLETMGVPSGSLETVKEQLLSTFRETAVPYLSSSQFPAKFVASRCAEAERRAAVRR